MEATTTIEDLFPYTPVWIAIFDYLVRDPDVHVSRNALALRMACRRLASIGKEYDRSAWRPKNDKVDGVITFQGTPRYQARKRLAIRYWGLMHSLLETGDLDAAIYLGTASKYMAHAFDRLAGAWLAHPILCVDCHSLIAPQYEWAQNGLLYKQGVHACTYDEHSVHTAHCRLAPLGFVLAMATSPWRITPLGVRPDKRPPKRRRLDYDVIKTL